MIHPRAAADAFLAPLHRSFLISGIVCGAAALIVLPLHLALAGPPRAATILVLAWMLSQWPLALYLSQSGNLDRAIALSSGIFACFVSAICALTGGTGSFAVVWLLIPPLEAAFSTSRKTAIGVSALTGALLCLVALNPFVLPEMGSLPGELRFVATLAALLYVGMLSLRISADRRRAQTAVQSSEAKRQMMSKSVSDVFCEIEPGGQMRVMGGPVKQVFGGFPAEEDGDWFFQRLHVADRPLFLTKLSEVRHGGSQASFEARLRVGSSLPGEAGHPEYHSLKLTIRQFERPETTLEDGGRLLMSIRPLDETGRANREPAGSAGAELWENAGRQARAALCEIVAQAELLEAGSTAFDSARVQKTAEEVGARGRAGLESLEAVLITGSNAADVLETATASIDIFACLDRYGNTAAALARENGVDIEVEAGTGLPVVIANEKLLRQAFCFLLADMAKTSGQGARIAVSAAEEDGGLTVVLSVRNRHSSLRWNAESSRTVLEFASELLERTGARLCVQTVLGHGENVIVRLPLKGRQSGHSRQTDAEPIFRPLAKTA